MCNGHSRFTKGKQASTTRLVARVGWVLWLVYTVALGALYIRIPPNPDQQIFDYIGWMALNGSKLYVDVIEPNFPGQMILHELSTWLFGNKIWSYRLLDYVLMLLVGCSALFALCRIAKRRWESHLVVPLYQTMYVTWGAWFSGQRDIVAAHVLVAVGAALICRERGGRALWLVAVGLGLVGAIMIRPNYLIFAVALLAHDALSSRARSRPWRAVALDALIVAGVMGAAGGAILLFAWKGGALAAWYDAYRQYVEYSAVPSLVDKSLQFWNTARSWHWYSVFSVVGAIAWWRRGIGRDVLGVLACLLATSLISAYLHGKGFGYHLGGVLPSFAIPIAACLVAVFEAWREEPTWSRSTALMAAAVITVLGLGKKLAGLSDQIEWYLGRRSTQAMLADQEPALEGTTMADVVAAAEFIERTTASDATLLTVPRPVGVNFLSRRRSPSRFITFGMLSTFGYPVPKKWSEEFAKMMATTPPDLVLVPAPNAVGEYWQFWVYPDAPGPVQLLRRELLQRYTLERRFGSMDLYRLAKKG